VEFGANSGMAWTLYQRAVTFSHWTGLRSGGPQRFQRLC